MSPNQREHIISPSELERIWHDILEEVCAAERQFPWWPTEPDRGVAIVAEEAGEAVRAANDHLWFAGPLKAIRTELIQTAAMCVRALAGLEV